MPVGCKSGRLLWLLWLLLPATALAEGEVWTHAKAWQVVLARHPALRGAQAEVDAARARVDQAETPLLPTTTLDASHAQMTANFTPRPGAVPASFKATAGHWSAEPFPYWLAQVNTRWNFTDFGRTRRNLDAAYLQVEAERSEVGALRRQLWLQLTQTYLQVLAAEASFDAARQQRDQAAQRRDLAKKKVEASLRPPLDLLRADSDLAAAEVGVFKADDLVRAMRLALGTAMGTGGLVQGPLAPLLPRETDLTPDRLAGAPPMDQWVDQAMAVRDDFKAIDQRMAALRAAHDALQKAALPSLFVAGQLGAGGIEVSNLVVNGSVTAGLSVPLSGAWLQHGYVGEMQAQLRSLAAARDVATLALKAELSQALTALQQARNRRPAAQTYRQFAEKAHEHALARYTAGTATLLEVVDAETAITLARLQGIQVEFDEALAVARWQAAMGRTQP
ncbi:MAG: TolC family protein [Deltaproteobacteria bacterium]|nr:TolC family protein [Deltaproteobacteria bacterium]